MIDVHVRIKGKTTTLSTAAIATAILLLLLSASAASASTITVDDSGGAGYVSIQAAMNNTSGDGVVDALGDCTHMARAIVGIQGYGL